MNGVKILREKQIMHIAITSSESKTQFYLNHAYINYILESGHFPYVIHTEDEVDQALKVCGGLILPGGIDLDPMHYGYTNYSSYSTNSKKDQFERTIFHAFRKAKKPILGICRGFQLIAMEFLDEFSETYEKVIKFVFHVENHAQTDSLNAVRTSPTHFVEYVPEDLYGKGGFIINDLGVNSMHHQCLAEKFSCSVRNGKNTKIETSFKNFTKIAWTKHGLRKVNEKGTIVEGFLINNWGGKILAIQWHPEELCDYKILHNLFGVESAKKKESQ